MSLLVLSAEDVDTISLRFNPEELQFLMAQVFGRLSYVAPTLTATDTSATNDIATEIAMPQRISIYTNNHTVLFMPARIGSLGGAAAGESTTGDTAIKVVSVPNKTDQRGLPATTLVLDEETGTAKAVINARKLTALRNAAGSLLSTSLVGPSDPRIVVAFGAGQQIAAHLDLHIRQFPSITHCVIVNRNVNERALSLKSHLTARFPAVKISLFMSDISSVESFVRLADIIICATSSTEPLFPCAWVKTGAHVILIGSYKPTMKEVDTALIARSLLTSSNQDVDPLRVDPKLLVDSREACLQEAGELIDAQVQPSQLTELGELIPLDSNGQVSPDRYKKLLSVNRNRHDVLGFDGPITIFKSVGVGLQDVAIASAVLAKALSMGQNVGTVIQDYDS